MTRVDRLSAERAAFRLREYRHLHERRLGTYRGIAERLADAGVTEHALPRPLLGRFLTLRLGIGYEEQVLAWCDWAASVLERHAAPAQASTTARRSIARQRSGRRAATRPTAAAARPRSARRGRAAAEAAGRRRRR